MKLLIDIGNSRTKYVYVSDSGLDDIQAIDNKVLTLEWMNECWLQTSKLVIASVGEVELVEKITAWCAINNIALTEVKTEAEKFGVTNGYLQPMQLGVDRWLTLLGANQLFPKKNCLIIDAGTATTLDMLTADGQHHGGWILAGIDGLVNSLVAGTENLQATTDNIKQPKFGLTTQENITQASWLATIGLIEQALKLTNEQQIPVDKLIITGGNGETLARLLSSRASYIPTLVFQGLQRF